MTIQAPSNEEILFAVSEVFDRVRFGHSANLLNALVVVDKTMHQGHRVINYVVDYEMQELCDFTNEFKAHLKQTEDRFHQARIKVLIYCHIMEADLPLTVFWNLLRILKGDACDWTFHRITKSGDKQVCQYPSEKVDELRQLSERLDMQIGRVWIVFGGESCEMLSTIHSTVGWATLLLPLVLFLHCHGRMEGKGVIHYSLLITSSASIKVRLNCSTILQRPIG